MWLHSHMWLYAYMWLHSLNSQENLQVPLRPPPRLPALSVRKNDAGPCSPFWGVFGGVVDMIRRADVLSGDGLRSLCSGALRDLPCVVLLDRDNAAPQVGAA